MRPPGKYSIFYSIGKKATLGPVSRQKRTKIVHVLKKIFYTILCNSYFKGSVTEQLITFGEGSYHIIMDENKANRTTCPSYTPFI